jgi:NADH:ubiquinone oxidoreductase subunit 6 (subunit J)
MLMLVCGPALAQDAPPSMNPRAPSIEHPVQSARTAEVILFYLFGGLAAVCALGALISSNIIRTATWLLGNLIAVACLFFLLGANFLGAIQLIVYAGGILVLIVFGVMLTSRLPVERLRASRAEVIGAVLVCLALCLWLIRILTQSAWPTARPAEHTPTIAEFGRALLSDYLVPFEVASALLLVVMVGAAYLARAHKK